MGNGARECEWHHAPEGREGFWEVWKSQLVELRTRLRTGKVDFRGTLRPVEFAHYGRRSGWGCRWKSQHRKNLNLSPYVEEPLNSKVIKSFVPELRSRKCFSCFEIPMFYQYMLWTFYVRFAYPYHGYGTPFHLRSNGLGERFVDILKRALKKVRATPTKKKRLQQVPQVYRITPNNKTPAL